MSSHQLSQKFYRMSGRPLSMHTACKPKLRSLLGARGRTGAGAARLRPRRTHPAFRHNRFAGSFCKGLHDVFWFWESCSIADDHDPT